MKKTIMVFLLFFIMWMSCNNNDISELEGGWIGIFDDEKYPDEKGGKNGLLIVFRKEKAIYEIWEWEGDTLRTYKYKNVIKEKNNYIFETLIDRQWYKKFKIKLINKNKLIPTTKPDFCSTKCYFEKAPPYPEQIKGWYLFEFRVPWGNSPFIDPESSDAIKREK